MTPWKNKIIEPYIKDAYKNNNNNNNKKKLKHVNKCKIGNLN